MQKALAIGATLIDAITVQAAAASDRYYVRKAKRDRARLLAFRCAPSGLRLHQYGS